VQYQEFLVARFEVHSSTYAPFGSERLPDLCWFRLKSQGFTEHFPDIK
jgi:hypothetical protein